MKSWIFRLLSYRCFTGIVLVFLFTAITAPVAITFVISFWSRTMFGFEAAFTLENYATFFTSQRVDVLLRTIAIAISSTMLMLVIAFSAAFIINRTIKPHWQRTVLFLFAAPFLVNYIVRILVWTEILGRNGIINAYLLNLNYIVNPLDWLLYSNFSVYIGLISAYLPFMIFPIWVSLNSIERTYEHASWMLGRNRAETFLSVTLPLSLPGVTAAFIFGFVGVFGEIAVSRILGGAGFQLYGNTIESALNTVNYPLSAAMSSISIGIMLVLLFTWLRFFDLKLFLGDLLPSR